MLSPFQLSQTDSRAMYVQIMDNTKQLIVTGGWLAGHSLPSIREMAVALKVSVITVKRAYQELEREGLIVTRHCMGSFVASQTDIAKEQKQTELERNLNEAIKLAELLGIGKKNYQKH